MKSKIDSYNRIYIERYIKLTYDEKQDGNIHVVYYSYMNLNEYFSLHYESYHKNHETNFYLFWLKK